MAGKAPLEISDGQEAKLLLVEKVKDDTGTASAFELLLNCIHKSKLGLHVSLEVPALVERAKCVARPELSDENSLRDELAFFKALTCN